MQANNQILEFSREVCFSFSVGRFLNLSLSLDSCEKLLKKEMIFDWKIREWEQFEPWYRLLKTLISMTPGSIVPWVSLLGRIQSINPGNTQENPVSLVKIFEWYEENPDGLEPMPMALIVTSRLIVQKALSCGLESVFLLNALLLWRNCAIVGVTPQGLKTLVKILQEFEKNDQEQILQTCKNLQEESLVQEREIQKPEGMSRRFASEKENFLDITQNFVLNWKHEFDAAILRFSSCDREFLYQTREYPKGIQVVSLLQKDFGFSAENPVFLCAFHLEILSKPPHFLHSLMPKNHLILLGTLEENRVCLRFLTKMEYRIVKNLDIIGTVCKKNLILRDECYSLNGELPPPKRFSFLCEDAVFRFLGILEKEIREIMHVKGKKVL